MAYLLDTNVLLRLADNTSPAFVVSDDAVSELRRRGDVLHVTAQVLIEFRSAATRPASVNGLGLTAPAAESHAARFESRFSLLPDTPNIYPTWRAIVTGLGIIGKQVHDARLVAVCHVHAVTHLLTFNVAHFARLATFAPGIVVVDPATV